MQTYIALLRGINVSGHKIIKMETLRKALETLDFKNVSTYIQSGNILFQSNEESIPKLEKQIVDLIFKHFSFDVPVTIVTPNDLKKIVRENPYADEKITDPAQPYVSFLSEIPASDKLNELMAVDFKGDNFRAVGNVLYLQYLDSAGNSKLSNAIIESKLKLRSTARNWKTVQKLIELAEAIQQ